MATEEQGKAVKKAADLMLEAAKLLSAQGVKNAELDTEIASAQIVLQEYDNSFRLSFTVQQIVQGDRIEDDEKLPGTTPTPAPSPVPIDHFDLG